MLWEAHQSRVPGTVSVIGRTFGFQKSPHIDPTAQLECQPFTRRGYVTTSLSSGSASKRDQDTTEPGHTD